MASRGLEDVACRRAAVTGENYQIARDMVLHDGRKPNAVPEASGQQRLVEGLLFRRVIRDANYFGYAGTLRSVSPTPSNLRLTIGTERLAPAFLLMTLPAVGGSDMEPIGVPGLRVASIESGSLHLRLLDADASITVQGAPQHTWENALNLVQQRQVEDGLTACWTKLQTNPFKQEREALNHHLSYTEVTEGGLLASSLLRRIGALNCANAFCVNAWSNLSSDGEAWIIEFISAPGALRRDALISKIVDPVAGLPMRLLSLSNSYDSAGEVFGRATFEGIPPHRGQLQVRFSPSLGEDSSAYRYMQEDQLPAERLADLFPSPQEDDQGFGPGYPIHRLAVPRLSQG